jgi:lipoate-protein ligase B
MSALTGVRAAFWGTVPYKPAIQRMEAARRDRLDGKTGDTIFYLEHEPVVTYGRATPPEHLHREPHNLPLVEVRRGGLATYHGFGQLVGYCVIDLAAREGGRRPDIHEFLRALEDGLARFLLRHFRLRAAPFPGHTGVWIHDPGPPRKIASIGISVRRWVTAHGFALNISTPLEAFRAIVPCGITEYETTSVARELESAGQPFVHQPMKELARALHPYVCEALQERGWCRPTAPPPISP